LRWLLLIDDFSASVEVVDWEVCRRRSKARLFSSKRPGSRHQTSPVRASDLRQSAARIARRKHRDAQFEMAATVVASITSSVETK
jgi:hypothetical protein